MAASGLGSFGIVLGTLSEEVGWTNPHHALLHPLDNTETHHPVEQQ